MNKMQVLPVLAGLGLILAGPANSAPPQSGSYTRIAEAGDVHYGVIDAIDVVPGAPQHSGAAGTIIGGLVGGLLGHQVGRGSGQTAATVVGAVGGAVAGNAIEKNSDQPADAFRVRVALDNGANMMLTQSSIGDLRVGDRVRVENDRLYRY